MTKRVGDQPSVGRRVVLKLAGASAASVATAGGAVVLVGCGDDTSEPPPESGSFFDEAAWAIVDAATEVMLPSDADAPAAKEARVVAYIDTLLSAFDFDPPRIFAGGPYSGRRPFPAADGSASEDYPDDAFAQFMPLSRVHEMAWRIRIYGSEATPGGDFNDAVLGPTRGYRDIYTDGVAALEAAAQSRSGVGFAALALSDRSAVLTQVARTQPDFAELLLHHTLEGTFAAPEYGGNEGLAGWSLSGWDGDSMPMGCSYYDEASGTHHDVPDRPTSIATPGDEPEDFDPMTVSLLEVAALGSGGQRFF